MIGLGTIINVGAIILGGLIGGRRHKIVKEKGEKRGVVCYNQIHR